MPIVPFDSEEEVIKLANQTEYGLSAEVYTTDLEKAERVAKQIECGVVGVNTDNYFKPESPFGGIKKRNGAGIWQGGDAGVCPNKSIGGAKMMDKIKNKLEKEGKFWIAFVGDSITSTEWVHPNWREIVEYVLKEELQKVFTDYRIPFLGIRCFNHGYDGATTKDILEK